MKDTVGGMPRKAPPELTPGDLAYAVAEEIQKQMNQCGLSGNELAKRIKRSQDYVAKRLRKELAFTLSDLGTIAPELGLTPQLLITTAAARIR